MHFGALGLTREKVPLKEGVGSALEQAVFTGRLFELD
jgi:hypothetical protein